MDKLETFGPEEVAAAIGASPWWVREQARRGRIRFLPEHVDALVRRATVREYEAEPEPVDLTPLGAPSRQRRSVTDRPQRATVIHT